MGPPIVKGTRGGRTSHRELFGAPGRNRPGPRMFNPALFVLDSYLLP